MIFKKLIFYALITLPGSGFLLAQNPCPLTPGTNLVPNGDFSAGNTGFTSPAQTAATGSPPAVGPGNYGVWTNPQTTNSYYASITDHTSGTGNMLIVDVNGTVGSIVYQATIPTVTVGQTYFFSAWFANLNATFENSPILTFSINGTQIGNPILVDSTSHSWTQFFTTYKATTGGPITIQIKNLRPGSNGNDLALDDIIFSGGCDRIKNLNTLGQTPKLMDTLYACNYTFPSVLLSTGMPSSGYGYTWKDASGNPMPGTNNQKDYTLTSAPATSKIYLCYDTIAGCPRKDSVIVVNQLNVNIKPDLTLCPPVNYTFNTYITNPAVTFLWKLNGTPIAAATGASYTATAFGTYSVTVTNPSNPGCGTKTSSATISPVNPTLTATGTYCLTSSPKISTFTISGTNKLNCLSNISFYNASTGGSAVGTKINDTTYTIPSPNFITSVPGCAAGIYVQDNNSLSTSVTPGNPSGCSGGTARGDNNTFPQQTMYQITVYTGSLTINSVDIYQNNYSTGGTASYQVRVWKDNPTITSTCGTSTSTPAGTAPLLTSAAVTYPKVTTPALRTMPVNLTLTGTCTGTKYWIEVYSTAEHQYFPCTTTYPKANTGTNKIIEINQMTTQGCFKAELGNMFNIQATAGKTNSCGRQFFCATQISCPLPVDLLYVKARKQSSGNLIEWATSSEKNNAYFIVQKSADGITFSDIVVVSGSGNSSEVNSYSYLDKDASFGDLYYRIKQVDIDGRFEFSQAVAVENSLGFKLEAYPVPVRSGENLHLAFEASEEDKVLVTVFDNPGKKVLAKSFSVSAGMNNITLNTSSLSPGFYLIQLQRENGKQETLKIAVE